MFSVCCLYVKVIVTLIEEVHARTIGSPNTMGSIAAEMLRLHGVSGRFSYTLSRCVRRASIFTAICYRHSAAPREIVVATTPYALW
jgi:hypothetical protein